MDPATVLVFAGIIKGVLAVIAEQMKMAGATEDQINLAMVKARTEMDEMDPDTLRN